MTLRDAEQKTIVIPRLEKLPAQSSLGAKKKGTSQGDVDPDAGRKTRRTLAWAAGGVGVAAVAVGAFFGLRAMSKKSASDSHCNGKLCDPQGLDLNDQAKSAATVSNIGFGVGLVALGAGAYLYFTSQPGGATSKPAEAESAKIRLAPSIGPGAGAILMTGRW